MCVFLRLAAQTEDPTVLLELLRALKGVGGGGGGGGDRVGRCILGGQTVGFRAERKSRGICWSFYRLSVLL